MNLYLDTSVLVALFAVDDLTGRADAFLRRDSLKLFVSDFGAAEFASVVSRRVERPRSWLESSLRRGERVTP